MEACGARSLGGTGELRNGRAPGRDFSVERERMMLRDAVVLERVRELSCTDQPLPIGSGRTISPHR
jgi:hypothetical protein